MIIIHDHGILNKISIIYSNAILIRFVSMTESSVLQLSKIIIIFFYSWSDWTESRTFNGVIWSTLFSCCIIFIIKQMVFFLYTLGVQPNKLPDYELHEYGMVNAAISLLFFKYKWFNHSKWFLSFKIFFCAQNSSFRSLDWALEILFPHCSY